MRILLGIAAVLVGSVAGLALWMGVFTPVDVAEYEMGPYAFVYVQEPSAEFNRIGELTDQLAQRLDAAGITNRRPAQIYYPVGRAIPNQIGFIVDRPLETAPGGETLFREVPMQRCIVAEFPFRNPASFIVGHYRVNDALQEYRLARGYAEASVMVVLDGDRVFYLQPIEPKT